MKGKELIEYIQKNNLEEKTIIIINNEGDCDSLYVAEDNHLVVESCVYYC